MNEPIIIGKPVILVVDRNPEWIEAVDFNLGDQFMIVRAHDLADAFRMSEKYAPAVILLDWQIAKHDPERARVGVSNGSQGLVPVILVTGFERPEVENIADLIGGCIAIVERLDTLSEVKREIAKVVSCAENDR
jgi:CheY-like chemotaxis protein